MIRFVLSFILLFNYSFAQVNSVVSKFFFDLPYHASKFDTRTKIQGNNVFFDFNESGNSMGANFKFHSTITNLPKKHREPYMQISFDDKGLTDTKRITVDYDVTEVNTCMTMYDEIIKLFKPYTKKTAPSAKRDLDKTGKGIQIFPVDGAKFYMVDITCEYHETAKRYELTILMFENNWWK